MTATRRTRKGIWYWPSYDAARQGATLHGWPIHRIIRYELGWAAQRAISGPYLGPDELKKQYT